MLPAALTVVILVVALVGGGVWVANQLSTMRDDIDVMARELGLAQNEIKALKQRTGS